MGRKTDQVIADHVVVDALLMGAKSITNMSNADIARDYARQEKITRVRAEAIREDALKLIHPVVEAIAKRGGVDFVWPPK